MTRRSDGRWQEKILVNGKAKYFYGKTKAEVTKKMRLFQEQQTSGSLFPAVADEWWEKHEKTLAHNTAKSYLPAVRRAQEHFSGVDVATIRPVDISRFLAFVADEMEMAEKTAKTQLLVTNLIFRHAVNEGHIDINPCADVQIPSGLAKKQRSMPSHEDLERVKSFIDHTFGFFAYFVLCTGLRRGEVLGLQWKNINLKKRTITVDQSVYFVSNEPHIKKPKTQAGIRTVPILDALLPYLTPGKTYDYLFGGPKLLKQSQFDKAWEHYCNDTGVSCTPHQLRHAYTTMLIEAGIEPAVAMKLLGHAQISTTIDIYTHLREERQAEIRDKLLGIELIK